jgi:hypothetical protein
MKETMPTNPATAGRPTPTSNDPLDVFEAALEALIAHNYPYIQQHERYADEDDPDDNDMEYYYTCPHCEEELLPVQVVTVDMATRETNAHAFDHNAETFDFSNDDDGAFGDALYYYHDGCSYAMNRVSLPVGWGEDWT